MKVAITDANIFIDILSLDLIDKLFNLGFEVFTVPEVLDELEEEHITILSKEIEGGRLIIHSLNENESEEVSSLNLSKGLSRTDKVLYYYSKKVGCVVLTEDKKLRDTMHKNGCEVHGIVWLFDHWVGGKLMNKSDAVKLLQELIKINPFLPISECQNRIDKWLN